MEDFLGDEDRTYADGGYIRPVGFCPRCRQRFRLNFLVPRLGYYGMEDVKTDQRCPKGHELIIEDQHYNPNEELITLFPDDGGLVQIIPVIETIFADIEAGRQTPLEGLNSLAVSHPEVLATIIQEGGFDDPLRTLRRLRERIRKQRLRITAAGIMGLTGFVADGLTVSDHVLPSQPPAQTIINNYNTTNIYPPAAGDGSQDFGPKPVKREQIRRLKQMNRQRQKIEKQSEHKKKARSRSKATEKSE